MQVTIVGNHLHVERDLADPKFGKDESWFYYRLKQHLQKLGYDCIKKLAWKDGNLVDDHMYYIRDRKNKWYIYDNEYACRLISQQFDKEGVVVLTMSGEINVSTKNSV